MKPVNLVPSTPQFSPKLGLGDVYNYENETFKILNRVMLVFQPVQFNSKDYVKYAFRLKLYKWLHA